MGQALATEPIAECINSAGVWEAESNIDLLHLVSIPAAADWDASFTVKRINLLGQALATEPIAECIRSADVWEAESNIDLLHLVSIPAAADWNASFTVKHINL